MNNITIIGRVCKDIELKDAKSGNQFCSFSLASRSKFKEDGKNKTDFFNCIAWNDKAKVLSSYAHKGSLISVEGCMQSNNRESTTYWNVVVNEIELLGSEDKKAVDKLEKVDDDEELPF